MAQRNVKELLPMKIKVGFNDTFFVWRDDKCNLSNLKEFASRQFNLEDSALQYEDDEGDRTFIVSDEDLMDALKCAQEEARKSLKIYTTSKTQTPDTDDGDDSNVEETQETNANNEVVITFLSCSVL
eukprot:310128_1